jgi:O-antigen/teichoic acid export membrane protein
MSIRRNIWSYLQSTGLGATLVRVSVGSVGIRVAGMIFGFITGVLLARGLGVEGYGVYGLAMSIISVATIPTEFGLPQLVTREVAAAQARNDWSHVFGVSQWADRAVIWSSAGVFTVVIAALVLMRQHISLALGVTIATGMALLPFIALGNLRGATLRGLQHIQKGQFPEFVLRPAIFSLLLFVTPLVIARPLSPWLSMVLQVISAIATFAIAGWLLAPLLKKQSTKVGERSDSIAWWRSALPMALTEGIRILYGNASILILGALATTATVGVFRIALSIAVLIAMPVNLLHVVSAPIFARLYAEGDNRRLQQMLGWVALAMSLGVLLLTAPFFFFGAQLMGTIFGVDFQSASVPLIVLSVGTFIGTLFGASAILLNMTGHEKKVARAFGASLILLVVLSPPMIVYWGDVGAALANAVATITWGLIMWRDAKRALNLDTSVFAFFSSGK